MSKFITLVLVVCLAGCVTSSTPTTPSSSPPPSSLPTSPSMCGLYIGGYGACIGNCSASRVTGAAAFPCVDTCTPGGPGEPPTCQKQPGCEAMQEAQAAAAYASCMSQCDAMPMECR